MLLPHVQVGLYEYGVVALPMTGTLVSHTVPLAASLGYLWDLLYVGDYNFQMSKGVTRTKYEEFKITEEEYLSFGDNSFSKN